MIHYPPEIDPSVFAQSLRVLSFQLKSCRQIPQPYHLNPPQVDVPQLPSFRWSPHFDTPIIPENQWALTPKDANPSADENSQDLQVLSAWRRASQASPSQTRVLRQTRLRENSSGGEKQGSTFRAGCTSKITSNPTLRQDELHLAHPGYDATTHTLDEEHHLECQPMSNIDGSIHEQRSEYRPITHGHIQEHQPGHDPMAAYTFQGPQAAAYFVPGPYGSWSWGPTQ